MSEFLKIMWALADEDPDWYEMVCDLEAELPA